jgi:hypothetical protein
VNVAATTTKVAVDAVKDTTTLAELEQQETSNWMTIVRRQHSRIVSPLTATEVATRTVQMTITMETKIQGSVMICVDTSKMYMTLKQGFASVAHRSGPHQLCDIKSDNLQLQMTKEILTNKSSIQTNCAISKRIISSYK